VRQHHQRGVHDLCHAPGGRCLPLWLLTGPWSLTWRRAGCRLPGGSAAAGAAAGGRARPQPRARGAPPLACCSASAAAPRSAARRSQPADAAAAAVAAARAAAPARAPARRPAAPPAGGGPRAGARLGARLGARALRLAQPRRQHRGVRARAAQLSLDLAHVHLRARPERWARPRVCRAARPRARTRLAGGVNERPCMVACQKTPLVDRQPWRLPLFPGRVRAPCRQDKLPRAGSRAARLQSLSLGAPGRELRFGRASALVRGRRARHLLLIGLPHARRSEGGPQWQAGRARLRSRRWQLLGALVLARRSLPPPRGLWTACCDARNPSWPPAPPQTRSIGCCAPAAPRL